jgi:hypothetical protein
MHAAGKPPHKFFYIMKTHFLAILLLFSTPVLADTKIGLDDGTGRAFQTTIPGSFTTPEGVLAALFTLSDQAANKDLIVPFFKPLNGKGKKPLMSYFRGAHRKGNTIVVSFSQGAMDYLNSTATFQKYVKGAIFMTLRLNFPWMSRVVYEVDGKIVEGWDA